MLKMVAIRNHTMKLCLLVAGILTLGAFPGFGAGPGDQAIVVYNSRSPESKALAQYYAEKRQVPPEQIFGFDLPETEEISRATYRDDLQKPLAKALASKKLWRVASSIIPASTNGPSRVEWKVVESKIRYAVLCYGMPLKIAPDASLKEAGTENLRPEMRRNEAAVDSELSLLPLMEQRLPAAGPLRNPVYSVTNAAGLGPTNGVLLVARLDGPTPAIARRLVDDALQAERDGLWGRAYFDLRSLTDPGFKMGEDWISGAAEISRRLGLETVVDNNPGVFPAEFPVSHIALYMGWYTENVAGALARPKVEFVPGSIAYHLHSFSAASLRTSDRHWVGPLLARGATAAMGSVYEPYLAGTPDLGVFATRLIFSSFTFGEAAYACQAVLSWQTTVVGDPLYRPFGDPERLHDDLTKRDSKLVEWSYLRLLNLNLANGKPLADCVALLEQLDLTKRSAVLSEKLADLYAAQGKPASAVHILAQAVNLDPSYQQKVRLLLALAEKQLALNRESDAYATYQSFLQQVPDYPAKAAVYKQLLTLAQKLDKKADAEKYEAELNRAAPLPPPKQS
ncbi:MAG TPA: TIGR03790 family protein [Clostridia bacterium]|nr:TIGR03790 family protein [Clostridia bacterium]